MRSFPCPSLGVFQPDMASKSREKEVRIQRLQPEIRHYIEGYCFGLSIDERVMGIVLFGSYARGTETEWSDIDLFIVFKGTLLEGLKLFSNMDKNLQRDRDRIVKDERYPYMSPFFVDTESLYDLNPIYFEAIKDLHSLLYVTSVATHYTSCCIYLGYFEQKMTRGLLNKLDTA